MIGKRKGSFALALFTTLILLTYVAPTVQAEEENKFSFVSSVEVEETEDKRAFTLNTEIYTEDYATQEKSSGIVLLIDVSDDMNRFAQPPSEESALEINRAYEDIQADEIFYALYDGVYKPVALQENCWKFVQIKADGEKVFGDEIVGERSPGDKPTDRFTQKLWRKEDGITMLDQLSQTIVEWIDEVAVTNPSMQVGIVWFSGDVEIYEPVTLSAENVPALREIILSSDKKIAAGRSTASALAEAKALLDKMKEAGVERRNVITITSGLCSATDNVLLEGGIYQAKANAEEIEKEHGKLYAYGLYSEALNEEEEKFFRQITSDPYEDTRITGEAEELLEAMRVFVGETLSIKRANIVMELEPEFILASGEKEALIEIGALVSEVSGKTRIEWESGFPRTKENAFAPSFRIEANEDFPGGNDLSILTMDSGIYQGESKRVHFTVQTVNVPIKLNLSDFETEIFLGQKIPEKIENKPIHEFISPYENANWFGKVSSGYFSHLWENESGVLIGKTEDLKNFMPENDTLFRLRVTYTPNTSGESSIGKANTKFSELADFRVKVVSGKVHVMLNLDAVQDKDQLNQESSFLYRLEGNNYVEYKMLSPSHVEEDGEERSVAATFDHLPFGTYTLTQMCEISPTEGYIQGGAEPIELKIGLSKDSDIIDLSAQECLATPIRKQLTEKEKDRSGDVKTNRFILAPQEGAA